MPSTVHVIQRFSVHVDGKLEQSGTFTHPSSIPVAGEMVRRKVTVPVESTVKLFDSAEDFEDFKFVWIQTDFDVMVEKVTDNGGAGEQAFTEKLLGSGVASKFGPAMILSSAASYLNYTKDFAGGTLDTIDTIKVRNLSATQVAQVFIFAIK